MSEARPYSSISFVVNGDRRTAVLMRRLRTFGYTGAIFPIHPTAGDIDGLPAYASLAATPEPIDYLYISVPAQHIPGILANAAGRARFCSGGRCRVRHHGDAVLQIGIVITARRSPELLHGEDARPPFYGNGIV